MEITQIEEQLTDKAVQDLKECSRMMVNVLKNFAENKAGRGNASGLSWPTSRTYNKDWTKYDSVLRTQYTYEYNHLNYNDLEKYFFDAIQHAYLDHLVEQKTRTLLSKLELLD